jgi:endonuclease I
MCILNKWTLIFFLFPALLSAQYQQDVLPGLDGQELNLELVKQYKPATVLGYGQARDTLYSKIYNRNDTIYCVYSGYGIYLPPNTDPTDFLLMGGSDNGINTEHTYPQSKGAGEGNPRSDMHHLFPARAAVNSARSNYPYAEIPDNETDVWYYKDFSTTQPPPTNRDSYSEVYEPANFPDRRFEPREDHKGNVARAVFYFYTMYRSEANAADPFYFDLMRETLCEWHFLDPVDSLEWAQNFLKATYQDGRPNPFILDCTLPERSYCSDLPYTCFPISTQQPEALLVPELKASPNPFFADTRLDFQLDQPASAQLELFDLLGNRIASFPKKHFQKGEASWPLTLDFLPPGAYLARLLLSSGQGANQLLSVQLNKF